MGNGGGRLLARIAGSPGGNGGGDGKVGRVKRKGEDKRG
jgi:hypothetical protein